MGGATRGRADEWKGGRANGQLWAVPLVVGQADGRKGDQATGRSSNPLSAPKRAGGAGLT